MTHLTDVTPLPATARPDLDRLLNPKTVAIVGASDGSAYATNTKGTLDSDAEVFIVNPRYETVFGRACYSSLSDIGRPVDAVFSLMAAERTTDLIEEAAQLQTGGVITIAGGYAEMGAKGAQLQDRLQAAAARANMPVIGPNGTGYVNVPRKLDLTMLTHFERRAGGVSLITHSGAALEAVAASAWRAGGVGFNRLISSGNEPVTDMADLLQFLVDDDETRIICLVLEKIRRPDAFFAAAAKAREIGKPVLAIKLARTTRTQRMALSHTGTLTGDPWVYEQAMKQAGILRADEIDELVDRLQFLEQLPRERWSPVRGLFVFTGTGGFAAMAGDLSLDEGVDIPEVPELNKWIASVVPGATEANPLDATGFIGSQPEVLDKVLTRFFNEPAFDMHIFPSQHAEWNLTTRASAATFAKMAAEANQPAILAPLAGNGGRWLEQLRADHGVAIGNGLRGCLRGLNTMASFMRGRSDARVRPATDVALLNWPPAEPLHVAEGRMLPFEDSLALLSAAGIPTVRTVFARPLAPLPTVDFDGPYVVKLADVAHRSDIGGVRLGVAPDELTAAVTDLREIATERGLPTTVSIQEMITGSSEAFIGIRGSSELGPVVAFGLGGIFVEILGRVSGRMAPMTRPDAIELVEEFDDTGVLSGRRGQRPWDLDQLYDILVAAGRLAAGGRRWIETFDINPLVCGPNGIVAVDALCLLGETPV